MTESDLPAVAAIERENFSTPWSEQSFRDFLKREDTDFLVAETAVSGDSSISEDGIHETEAAGRSSISKDGVRETTGRIVGYIGAYGIPDEGDITNVSVSPAAQGMGIGQKLVQELVKAAGSREITRLFLEVRESNANAIHIYEKNGFRKVGLRKNYYEHPREHAVIMCRDQTAE